MLCCKADKLHLLKVGRILANCSEALVEHSQQTQNICITFIQSWTRRTLVQHWINDIQMFCVWWVGPGRVVLSEAVD